MDNKTPTADNAEIFQEICRKVDALLRKGFSDASFVRDEVQFLMALQVGHGQLLDIAAQVSDILFNATPNSKETERRIIEVLKFLGKAIDDAKKTKKALNKTRRRFKETLPYGQIPPLEEPHLLPENSD